MLPPTVVPEAPGPLPPPPPQLASKALQDAAMTTRMSESTNKE
jgi:hypothetical protein